MSHWSCCVVNCKNTSRKSECKFYKFPTANWKINQRNQWIAAVRRRNVDGSPWVPKPHDHICSDHFIGGKKSEEELSPSFIPTIFPSIYKSPKVNESSGINSMSRGMYPSKIQLEKLIDSIEKDPWLATCRAFKDSEKDRLKKAWQGIADKLNSYSGCIKTWQQWLQYWNGKKCPVKKKAIQIQMARQTGADAVGLFFTPIEERMLSLLRLSKNKAKPTITGDKTLIEEATESFHVESVAVESETAGLTFVPDNESLPPNSEVFTRMADLNSSELDKYRRRIIRSVARLLKLKKPPDEVWETMKIETGCDCQTLWYRMRALTVKKLNRLIAVDDRPENIPPVARLSTTDWLLFDLVLVNENIDVIGTEHINQTKSEYKPMFELFSLVQRYDIEDLIQARLSKELANAWAAALVDYNSSGRYCSPMLLQRRWYQIKEMTRTRFYNFWKVYRGNINNLKHAYQIHMPSRLQMVIAKRYPSIITNEFLTWEEMDEQKLVISQEVLEPIIKGNSLRKPNESSPDIVIVEPEIETIDLEGDSDLENENSETPATSDQVDLPRSTVNANIVIKQELLDTESSETIQNIATNIILPKITKIENALYSEENALDLEDNEDETNSDCGESDVNLNCDETDVPSDLQVSDIEKLIPPVDNIELTDVIIEERDKLIRSFNLDKTKTPQITNVCSLTGSIADKDSSDEEDIITPNISGPSALVPKTEQIEKDVQKCDTETEVSVGLKSIDSVKESVTLHNKLNQNLNEVVTIDLDFVDDGIDFVDDGIIFIDEDTEQNGKNQDTNSTSSDSGSKNGNTEFDMKLLMSSVVCITKLDDMAIFKCKSFNTVTDIDVINRAIAESKIKIDDKKCTHSLNIDSLKQETFDEELSAENKTNDQESSSSAEESFKVSQSSHLLRKPISRSYNPIQLCKNPDFNTRLKRLTVGFLSSTRNRQLYKACKPMTIDVSTAFESKLVDGTMYLKMCDLEKVPSESQKAVISTATQSVAVLPSAISVQSLIDHTVSIELVPQKINQDQDIVKPCEPVTKVLTNESPKSSISQGSQFCTPGPLCSKKSQSELDVLTKAIDDDGLLAERKKAINLPDIIKIRRINQHLLTAEVSPMRPSIPNTVEPIDVQSEEKSIRPEQSPYQNKSTDQPRELITQPVTTTNKTSLNAIRRQKQKELQEKLVRPSNIKNKFPFPWIKPTIRTIKGDEALLTSDTLNKMLVVLTGDQNMMVNKKKMAKSNSIMQQSIELIGTSVAVKTASVAAINNETDTDSASKDSVPDFPQAKKNDVTKNKEKLHKRLLKRVALGAKRSTTRKNDNTYCCWMRLKMERPYIISQKHSCLPYECICCCRSHLYDKIVHYWSLNEKMKVKRLLVLTSTDEELRFHRQFTGRSAVLSVASPDSKECFEQETSSGKSQNDTEYVINVEDYDTPTPSNTTNIDVSFIPNTTAVESPVQSDVTIRAVSPVISDPTVPSDPVVCTVPSPFIVSEVSSDPTLNSIPTTLTTSTETISTVSPVISDSPVSSDPVSCTVPSPPIVSEVSSDPTLTSIPSILTTSTVPTITPIPTNFLLEKALTDPPVVHPEIISLDDLPDDSHVDVAPKVAISKTYARTKFRSKTNLHSPNILKKSCICHKSIISPHTSSHKQLVIDGTQVCPIHKSFAENRETTAERKNKILLLKRKQILMNSKSHESPIFLGKNQILLTTARIPKSFTNSSKVITAKLVPSMPQQTTVPDGVNFMLLPNGKLTYTIDPEAKLSVDQLTSLPAIVTGVEQQLTSPTPHVPEVHYAVQNKDSITENISMSLEQAPNVETDISNVDHDNTVSTDVTSIPDSVQENIASVIGVQIASENEAENSHNTQPISMDNTAINENNENKSERKSSSNVGTIGDRNTILSDLMAMSGISSEDTTPNPVSEVSTPDLVSTPLNIHPSEITASSNSVILDLDNTPDLSAELRNAFSNLELTPVTSYSVLKHSCETNAHFFKLDFDTNLVVPINVSITKKNSKELVASKLNTSKYLDSVMIDLTEDVDDTENINTNVENTEDDVDPNLTMKKLKVYSYTKREVSPVKDSYSNVVKPMRLFKVSHLSKSNNRKRKPNPDNEKTNTRMQKQIAKRMRKKSTCRIEAKIDLVDSDAPMEEEYLIDSSSNEDLTSASNSRSPPVNKSDTDDDEPLAKIAHRMHKTKTSAVKATGNVTVGLPAEDCETERITESTDVNLDAAGPELEEIADEGVENVEGVMDVGMADLPSSEFFLLPVNDVEESQEDCILGV